MINKAILVGNLGKDPQSIPNGCVFSVATVDKWKDRGSGERKEATEWHNVVVFGKLSEICLKYLSKGAKVYIEGSIQTRKSADKNGVERYNTSINARDMKMLSGKDERSDERPDPRPQPDFEDADIPFS